MRNQIIASVTLASMTLAPGIALAADPPPPPPVPEVAEAAPAGEVTAAPEGPEAPPQMSQEERQRRADADRASDRFLVSSYVVGAAGFLLVVNGAGAMAASAYAGEDDARLRNAGAGLIVSGSLVFAGGVALLAVGINKRRQAHGLAIAPSFDRRGGGLSLRMKF